MTTSELYFPSTLAKNRGWTILLKISFYSHLNKVYFRVKSFAPSYGLEHKKKVDYI